jgi:ketosteroid isomerase-like protein
VAGAGDEGKRRALRNFIEAFNTGNMKLLDGVITDETTYTFLGTTDFAGVNNARKTIDELGRRAFPEGIKFDIKQIIVDGNFGCVRWEDLATNKGRKYHNYGVFFAEFDGNAIKKIWEYIDYERFKAFLDYDKVQRPVGDSAFD